MRIEDFGRIADGRRAGLYILRNNNGMMAAVTNMGAALVELIVPDSAGSSVDVVLGYDDAASYEKGDKSFGGTVGRFANRIGRAQFELNGRTYQLTANHGPNALHGGRDFYTNRLWDTQIGFTRVSTRDIAATYAVESIGDERTAFEKDHSGTDSVTFTLDSPDGDQGFPGDLRIEVTYTLTDDNELHIDYRARLNDADAEGATATALNLTNHSYFNLNGHDSGSVLDHLMEIRAGKFTATDDVSLPTGELVNVSGTPMDFRRAKPLGQDIGKDYEALVFGGGYDHNYALDMLADSDAGADECVKTDAREDGDAYSRICDGLCGYREVARLTGTRSGIHMTVLTDLPGIQLYTGNYIDDEPGKGGAVYHSRDAVCLETQFWPDAINHKDFPGGVLRAGEEFSSRTTYRFSN